MDVSDIIELIVLLLFFVLGPLFRRARQGREVVAPPETAPGGPVALPPPQQAPTPGDYAGYLVRNLRDQAKTAQRLAAAAAQSPLLELSGIAVVAEQLAQRTREAAAEVTTIVAGAVGDGESVPRATGLGLSRALEELRAPLQRARDAQGVLAELTSQRTDSRALRILELLDRVVAELDAGAVEARERRVIFYDGPPRVITEVLGAGPAGLVPFARERVARAGGWTTLAGGLAYDALSAQPDAFAELRAAAMFGPLAGKHASWPFVATATIDMAQAVGAWVPQLAADVVATVLLGRAYAFGLVETAIREGVTRLQSATIETRGGRYVGEAPLVVRLSVVDSILMAEGRTEVDNGLERLTAHFDLPEEGRFVRPNGLTQRILVAPLVEYGGELGQVLHTVRLSQGSGPRLAELVSSRSGVLERSRVVAAQRGLVAGEAPGFDAVTLLCAAALAEAEDAEDRPYVEPLVRSLVAPPPRAARRRAHGGRGNDRALLRDAIVLSEIL